MILEFCGLPATGKSTTALLLFRHLKDKGYKCTFVSSPTFYNLGLLNIFKSIPLIAINIFSCPRVFSFLARSIMVSPEKFSVKIYRLYISVQYHINWFRLKKLVKCKYEKNNIYILDGSPMNIFSDCWQSCVVLNEILPSILNAYEEGCIKTIVIVSDSDASVAMTNIKKRKLRPIEKILYADEYVLAQMQKIFLSLPSVVLPVCLGNTKIINYDLLQAEVIDLWDDILRLV